MSTGKQYFTQAIKQWAAAAGHQTYLDDLSIYYYA